MLDKNLIPETIPFDFDDNYAAVKQKFADYGYDTQEGSNAMQLAIAMSYLTSMLNANTAVNINEMLLPLARKRKNALQGARLLGYEIRHTLSYKYKLTLEFPEGMHKINRYEKFTVKDKNYYYMGDNISEFEGPTTMDIIVSEGYLREWRNDPSLVSNLSLGTSDENKLVSDYYVDVPYSRVAENGLRVFVSYTEPTGIQHDLEEYPRMDNFIIDTDSKGVPGYVRLDNIDFGTPRVYFKIGDVGLELPENTKVYIDALISSGEDGAMPEGNLETSLNCEVTDIIIVSNGSEEESIESIKRNAPLFHNSANRLVTKKDFTAFINRDTRVKSCTIWDGGDEYPYRPGNVWFSSLPNHTKRTFYTNVIKTKWDLIERDFNNIYITEDDIDDIKDSTKDLRVPTISLHHRKPVYLDFDYKIQVVRYSRSLPQSEWNERLFDTIDNYFVSLDNKPGVESYVFEYFQSNLDKRLDTVLTDNTGFNISLKNYITLSSEDILNEIINHGSIRSITNQIRFHLGTPFEKYYYIDDVGINHVLAEYLPRIKATINSKELFVDFDKPIALQNRAYEYPVMLGVLKVGVYRVFLDSSETIEVTLYTSPDIDNFKSTENGYITLELNNIKYYIADTLDGKAAVELLTNIPLREIEISGETFYVTDDFEFISYIGIHDEYLDRSIFDDSLELSIEYKSPNFKVTRNTLPSLRSVEFINR